jgi:hypothetical protein
MSKMHSQSILNDIREFELWLGIVPEFRAGPCDKSLEPYIGQPLPSHLKDRTPSKNSRDRDYRPPWCEVRCDQDGNITYIDLESINAREYAQETDGDPQMERGSNAGIYYF